MENTNLTYLVQSAVGGDKDAFSQLYELSNKRAYFAALCVTRDEQSAIDIIQISYTTAYQRLPRLKYPEKFQNWFNRIAAKYIYDSIIRKNPAVFTTGEPMDDEDFADETNDTGFDNIVCTDNTKIKILEILDRLSEDRKLCFLAYYYFGMCIDEISKVLGIDSGMITRRLNDAKECVKRETQKLLESDEALSGIEPIPFFCKALSGCSSHVPFKATDMILSSIFDSVPVSSTDKKATPHDDRKAQHNENGPGEDDATQMYSTEEIQQMMKNNPGTDFTPYGSEYSRGDDDENDRVEKVSRSASKAAKIAIIIAVAAVFIIAVFALAKNVLIDKDETTTAKKTTVSSTTQEYKDDEYTKYYAQTQSPTDPPTEEPTTEEPTTEEPTTQEPATEEPTTEIEEIPSDITEEADNDDNIPEF